MGKANRERRRAKEKARKRRSSARPAGGHGQGPFGAWQPSSAELARNLIAAAVQAKCDRDDQAFNRLVTALAEQPDVPSWPRVCETAVIDALKQAAKAAWHRGWQPAEVARMAGREFGTECASVAVDAIAAEMRSYPAAAVDHRWQAQLTALGARVWWAGDNNYLQARAVRDGRDRGAVIARAIEVIFVAGTLPVLPRIIPPPGIPRGGDRPSRPGPPERAAVNERMLTRIRALLAKAESTEFPEEAEALSTRAQELMARHSIDQALVDAASGRPGEPECTRLAVDNPYEVQKALLLDVVAAANRCRAVWHRKLGFSSVFGFTTDLGAVELLFTSLLVQATSAMVRAGARRDSYGRSRTRSFRTSFLGAYAQRIGERLTTAADSATTQAVADSPGGGLLPVLAARNRAVDRAIEEMFPELVERRVGTGRDHEGWVAGRAAADLASLTPRSGISGASGS